MSDTKSNFREIVARVLRSLANEKNVECDVKDENVIVQTPPDASMGDLGIPLFVFAKAFKMSPQQISSLVLDEIQKMAVADENVKMLGEVLSVGPYINLRVNKNSAIFSILERIENESDEYGSFNSDGEKPLKNRKVMIEFSSPNTNKPLHLGHVRNDALGESVSRILKKAGADVYKVDLINDRGVHICKSMLAYKLFHEKNGDEPEKLKMKGDHFVGKCYVEFDKYAKENPSATDDAEKMLVEWENGNEEVRTLWKKMNEWTISGVKETYRRTGISFDKFYLESETYLKGKDEIQKGLENGVFFRADDGSVRIDVTNVVGKGKDEDAHEKVLLRKDGTSVYITQDIGTAISRHEDWPFNQMVYVVASEQNYHFKILFYILKRLGFDWAEKLFHLSYGLVNLPNGRMKSREGTVVDADDLIDSLHSDALKEIKDKGRDAELEDADDVAEKVALAALHYYLLQVTPQKDMIFNPSESLNFNGNTGPYLQYMGARINSILKKADEAGLKPASDSVSELTSEPEWELVKALGDFPEIVEKSATGLDPSIMASYIYDVCKSFSKFYTDCPIINAPNAEIAKARLYLAKCTLTVIKNAMELVLVPFLEKM